MSRTVAAALCAGVLLVTAVPADIGPDKPWILHATLVDPDRWAMVAATSGPLPGAPMFRCELSVDGVVVDTAEGPKGALCAIRHW